MAGPALGLAAWGLVTGVAMVKSGLTVAQALGMALLVFAGSAQLTALPLMMAQAPFWVIAAAAFCVNLRFVIFSAKWRLYFGHLPRARRLLMGYLAGDLTFVNFLRRFPVAEPGPGQAPYFWGAVAVNWGAWQAASVVGIVAAHDIPAHWGLGFAGVLALLGMAYALLQERAQWIVAGVAAAVALLAYHLPLKLYIMAAIVAAGAVGWALDRRGSDERR
ncbi:AzlC family ABC transporter permease [Inhella sp. 4Y17]|uniref:AzlC family ABC transporter permease n=2 Tax=Inhella gelatinilytica TaxID=2795030 RepID=A0A931IXE2_9BURK|nr:AzlC family ABC transporter permease [Inhella gelatinilytica]